MAKPDAFDSAIDAERGRMVAMLRQLADRIEAAPRDRLTGSAAGIASAIESLVRSLDRILGRTYSVLPASRATRPGDSENPPSDEESRGFGRRK